MEKALKLKKFLATKNNIKEVKPSLRKYRINLNNKLISYTYDENNRETVKEKNQFIIPLNAQEITLIKDYKEQDSKNDPIKEVIIRGALPQQFENNTFLKYQNHFPKTEKEPILEVKELEEITKPKEKKTRKKSK